jgi:adenosylcobinamide-GDP ribazoletransferase
MINGLVFALQFLTRIPLNIRAEVNSRNIAKSTFFFPFIGMLIGAVAAGAYCITLFLGRDIAAISGVIALVFITGGLHIDGLSDTCDGFFSSRKKERILEIMKDSHSGTFGVIAVVLDILVKYILLSRIQTNVLPCLMLSCANARLTTVMLMSFTKTARPGGMGAMFSDSKTKKYFCFGSLLYVALIIVAFNFKYLIPLGIAMISSFLIVIKSYKTIDGLTGDVYGANIEICEIVSIAAFEAVTRWI